MGLMTMLGYFVGAGALGFVLPYAGVFACYAAIAGLNIICMILTFLSYKEPPVQDRRLNFQWLQFLKGMLVPWRSSNFRWVFITRFLMVWKKFSATLKQR